MVSLLLLGLGTVGLGGCATIWVAGITDPCGDHRRRTRRAAQGPNRAAAERDPWDLRVVRPPVGGASAQPVQLAASRSFLRQVGSWQAPSALSNRSLRPAGTSVRSRVARRARRLAPCFTGARGVVHLELLIRPSGQVGRVRTPGTASASVRRCVRQRARRWTFGPLPQTVRHRLTLRALGEEQ